MDRTLNIAKVQALLLLTPITADYSKQKTTTDFNLNICSIRLKLDAWGFVPGIVDLIVQVLPTEESKFQVTME